MPRSARALYFSMSAMKPEPLVCLPFVQTDPSISTATPDSCHQSTRHFLVGWKRYSGVSFGPLIARHRISNLVISSASPKLKDCETCARLAWFPPSVYPADLIPRRPASKTSASHSPAVPCISKTPCLQNKERSR